MLGYPQDNLKHMHAFQREMGDIQDTEVLLPTFEGFAERHEAFDPEPVLRNNQKRYSNLVNAFIEAMHQVNPF